MPRYMWKGKLRSGQVQQGVLLADSRNAAVATLRRQQMYEFMDRLITIALPRVRDFRGLNPKSFDGRGNYAMGIKEHIVFPEIEYDKVDQIWGMDIIICTTATTDAEAKSLLAKFNMPFSDLTGNN